MFPIINPPLKNNSRAQSMRSFVLFCNALSLLLANALIASPHPPPPPPFNTGSLRGAVDEYCTNATTAIADYGPIETWDTSAVESMADLFAGKSADLFAGKSNCNPKITD